jgi:hypothetical protein
MASPQSSYPNIAELRRTVSQEIYKVLGLSPDTRLRHVLQPLFALPTTQFAKVAANFDRMVANSGFLEAVRELQPHFISRLEVSGQEVVPEQGPLLVAANHPGAADAIAIAASLPRADLKMVVSALPFVRELPNLARHFIYTTLDPHQRMEVVIEPDPEVLPGADESLEDWSASLGIIARSVPQLEIVTAIVSGVLNRRSVRNPVTRLRKEPRERQKLAEIIQVIQQMLMPRRTSVNARVSFGTPIPAGRLEGKDARSTTEQVIKAARQLLSEHMALG